MTRPLARRVARVAALAALIAAAAGAKGDPEADKAKAAADVVFREVYGKEYDRVRGRGTPAEKAALAKKLWAAARETTGDPALFGVLADKALAAAAADPAGFPVAVEIRRARLTDGKDRPEQLAGLAGVVEKMARVEKPDRRAKLGADAVELYREAAEVCHDQGRDADQAAHLARAAQAAKALLPPALAAAAAKDLAADAGDFEADRRMAAEFKRLAAQLQARADDPKANQAMATALLRAGRPAAAVPHLRASGVDRLKQLGDALAAPAVADRLRAAELFRAAAADSPADKATLLGLARQQYEAALAAEPNVPDGNRLRLLVKELPPFKAVGVRPPAPGAVHELFDENKELLDTLVKGGGAVKSFGWSTADRYSGFGSLRVVEGTRGGNAFAVFLAESPPAGQYRYVRFAVKQVKGTRLRVGFVADTVPVANYVFGAAAAGEKCVRLADAPPAEWTVVTRDLIADAGVAGVGVSGLWVETDGEAFVDYVLFGRSARDLNRTALRPGPAGDPK